MKRVYDYHTGRMLNESNTVSRGRISSGKSNIQRQHRSNSHTNKLYNALYEAKKNRELDFYDEVIVNAEREICTDPELASAIFTGKGKPIAIWEYRGNRCAETITGILDEQDTDYCSVNMRSLAGDVIDRINKIYDGEEVLIIDEFTFGSPTDFADLLKIIDECYNIKNLKAVICVGVIDAPNNTKYTKEILENFKNMLYSPNYERMFTKKYNDDYGNEDEDEFANESVSEKFARYRKLYEADEDEDIESADETESSEEDTVDAKVKEPESTEEETEDVPMTAIVLTVKKDDVAKCKEELVDAGIPEDAITEIEDDDEESEQGKIKVDADYAIELKDYLSGKGIDLEEKIGGEIIDDTIKDEEPKDDETDAEGKEKDGEDEGELDFDKEFGDIFGDES